MLELHLIRRHAAQLILQHPLQFLDLGRGLNSDVDGLPVEIPAGIGRVVRDADANGHLVGIGQGGDEIRFGKRFVLGGSGRRGRRSRRDAWGRRQAWRLHGNCSRRGGRRLGVLRLEPLRRGFLRRHAGLRRRRNSGRGRERWLRRRGGHPRRRRRGRSHGRRGRHSHGRRRSRRGRGLCDRRRPGRPLHGLLHDEAVGLHQPPLRVHLLVAHLRLARAEDVPPGLRELAYVRRDVVPGDEVGLALLLQEATSFLGPLRVEELDAHVLRHVGDGDGLAGDGIDDVRPGGVPRDLLRGHNLGSVVGHDLELLAPLLVVLLHVRILFVRRRFLHLLLLFLGLPFRWLLRNGLLPVQRREAQRGGRRQRLHHLVGGELDRLDDDEVVPVDSTRAAEGAVRTLRGLPPALGHLAFVLGPVGRVL
mmetsp:Transcript_38254/g.81654  ORF Transcript_38254/g.81654 Transcript_38254/m.81654 type:complete len:420 (-) Transcript_38254:972-2231(-)